MVYLTWRKKVGAVTAYAEDLIVQPELTTRVDARFDSPHQGNNTDRNRQVSYAWQMDSYRIVIGETASFVLFMDPTKTCWGIVDGYCTSARPRRWCGDVA